MTELTLLDALIILFVLAKLSRAHKAQMGESMHALIAISLLIALFLGMRITSQVRDLMTGFAEFMHTVPGFGSKLLIILAAWYLMRLLRTRLGSALESITPQTLQKPITFVSEGLRAALLAGFIIWLADAWIAPNNPETSKSVLFVRAGDTLIAGLFDRPESKNIEEHTDPDSFFIH